MHVHVLAARCDLETGRSLNIAPPGWRRTFDPLRDAFNDEQRWSRPDDPERARVQQPGHRAYIEAAKLRAGLEHAADARELLRDYLEQRVEHGAVRIRADVIAALEDAGLEVPRQGKSYVTVRNPDDGKRWRLKGALYEHEFEPERLDRAAPAPAGGRSAGDGADRRARAEAARRELERRRAERAAYHRTDTAAWIGRVRGMLLRAWLLPLIVGLSLSLGISGGSWAVMRSLWTTIEQQMETSAVLDVDIKESRATLARIEAATWGVTLREIDGERFVVLPAGTLSNPP